MPLRHTLSSWYGIALPEAAGPWRGQTAVNDGKRPMLWTQRMIELPRLPRGCHLITSSIVDAIPEIGNLRVGLLHLFLMHTSASLSINENADPDVRRDLATALDHIAPEALPFTHTLEGPDDMPAHVKASLLGVSLMLPVREGRLALGTWQGIYLCEHRDHASGRRILGTLFGEPR